MAGSTPAISASWRRIATSVTSSGATVVEKELLSFLRANLANFKAPDQVVIRESLPRTSSGKTIRDAATLLGN